MTEPYEYCWLYTVEVEKEVGVGNPMTPVVVVLVTSRGTEVPEAAASLLAALDRHGRDGWLFDAPEHVSLGPYSWLNEFLLQRDSPQVSAPRCDRAFGRRRIF